MHQFSTLKTLPSGFSIYLRIGINFMLAVFILGSCKKDEPAKLPSGDITLSSRLFYSDSYYLMGYSFENNEFNKSSGAVTDIDIYLNELINVKGEPTGVQFATSSLTETHYGFYLNHSFATLEETEAFYDQYAKAEFPAMASTLSDTVRKFQVYTFRSWKSNYVKFMVKDIREIYTGEVADYLEVDIRYFIQKDGTDNLSD